MPDQNYTINPHIKALAADMSSRKLTGQEWTDALKSAAELLSQYRSAEFEVEVVKLPTPESVRFNEKKVRALFELADFTVLNVWRLENQYWPEAYVSLRINNPWWLVETKEMGLIEIGPRKSVYSASWDKSKVRAIVTEDNVTKSETMVHAHGLDKMGEYLRALRQAATA